MTRIHLCYLVVASMGGCLGHANLPTENPTATTTTTASTPATFDRKPEVLLSARKPERLIVAIDFAGSKAVDKSLSLDERRRYVLEQTVAAYAAYAKKERDDQPVR